jgi:hypothetical protein
LTAVTDSGVDDASVGVAMIERVEAAIARFTADGAYDTTAIYEALVAAGAPGLNIVIPPRRTASRSRPAEQILRQEMRPSRGSRKSGAVSGRRSPGRISRLAPRTECIGTSASSVTGFGRSRATTPRIMVAA